MEKIFYDVKENTLQIGNTQMDYITFGKGSKPLVFIPGLSLKRVKGSGKPLAYMYRIFAQEYRVYIFDKKDDIPETYTIKELAADVAFAMNSLGIENADIMGISQGGMIGQYLAMDYPQLVHKLVLGVTLSRNNGTVEKVIKEWITLAKRGDQEGIVVNILEKMYSEEYIMRYKLLFPLLSKAVKATDMERFIRLAKSCLTCNAYDELNKIQCPVLVIGGKQDKIVTPEASEEMAEKLGCEIYMYEDLGHSAYEEAKDFNERVLEFLTRR